MGRRTGSDEPGARKPASRRRPVSVRGVTGTAGETVATTSGVVAAGPGWLRSVCSKSKALPRAGFWNQPGEGHAEHCCHHTAALQRRCLCRTCRRIGGSRVETIVVTATRTEQPARKNRRVAQPDHRGRSEDTADRGAERYPEGSARRSSSTAPAASDSRRASASAAPNGQTVMLIDGVRINDPSDDRRRRHLSATAGQQHRPRRDPARPAIDALWQRRDRRRRQHHQQARRRDAVRAGRERRRRLVRHLPRQCRGATARRTHVEYGAALNYLTTTGISAADSRNGNTETDGYTKLRRNLQYAGASDRHGQRRRRAATTPTAMTISTTISAAAELHRRGLRREQHQRTERRLSRAECGLLRRHVPQPHRDHRDVERAAVLRFRVRHDSSELRRFRQRRALRISGHRRLRSRTRSSHSARRRRRVRSAATVSARSRRRSTNGRARPAHRLLRAGTDTLVRSAHAHRRRAARRRRASSARTPRSSSTARGRFPAGTRRCAPISATASRRRRLFQLFSANSNPITALKPETATGWEVGFDKSFWDGGLRALAHLVRAQHDEPDRLPELLHAGRCAGLPHTPRRVRLLHQSRQDACTAASRPIA